MSRKLLISLHLFLAAFFAPVIILIAASGGLYLIGEKGTITKETVYQGIHPTFNAKSESIKSDVMSILSDAEIADYQFEYVRVGGNTLYTRPTSRDHYILKIGEAGSIEIASAQPDLQASMMELHKGHGPQAFKTFQKFFAVGLSFIVLSGLWLGLSAPGLRVKSLIATTVGGIVLAILILT